MAGQWEGFVGPRGWDDCVRCGRPVRVGGFTCQVRRCAAALAAESVAAEEARRAANVAVYAERLERGYEAAGRSLFDGPGREGR